MRILWLTWKDKKNPLAGGAESINEEIAKRLIEDKHELTLLVGGFKKARKNEIVDGYKIIRVGNLWTVYWQAYRYYKKNLIGKFDLIIDEINTVPFFAKFYAKKPNILLIPQLCREIWFYQMFFPLNLIGYLLEPIYLWLLKDRSVITISESTKNDLLNYGFKKKNIHIISKGIENKTLNKLLPVSKSKESSPTILFLGAIRSMKRPDQVIKAFNIAKKDVKNLKLWIAGGGNGGYFKKVMSLIDSSFYKNDISYFGRVTKEKKLDLLQKAHLLCVTSVKEGWGLVVTEANSQGTPAVVYDIDGLRDSVRNNKTGIVCRENTPKNLAKNIIKLLENKKKYNDLRNAAWSWSKEMNFKNCYKDFKNIINNINEK